MASFLTSRAGSQALRQDIAHGRASGYKVAAEWGDPKVVKIGPSWDAPADRSRQSGSCRYGVMCGELMWILASVSAGIDMHRDGVEAREQVK
jgi:hypothetical protein